jgi:hypothetical protein
MEKMVHISECCYNIYGTQKNIEHGNIEELHNGISVPDKRSRILEVVVVRRILVWVLGIWSGEGMRKGEKGEVSLQATWDRGGQILSQQGGFPSK